MMKSNRFSKKMSSSHKDAISTPSSPANTVRWPILQINFQHSFNVLAITELSKNYKVWPVRIIASIPLSLPGNV